jgi:hypothetical protein
MIDEPRHWVLLTGMVLVAILAGGFVLFTERTLAGCLVLLVASLVLSFMWVWRTDATKRALQTIFWVLLWFITGGGSRGGG